MPETMPPIVENAPRAPRRPIPPKRPTTSDEVEVAVLDELGMNMPDVAKEPAIAKEPAVGYPVHCYEKDHGGLTNPVPGIVNRVHADKKFVEVAVLNPKVSVFAAFSSVDRVKFCWTDAELEAAVIQNKWVCKPYDPCNPKPYVSALPKKDE